jgi:hypothetical protein
MGQVQWGSVAEWVGGVGTIGAVLFAAISVRTASKSARATQADAAFDEASTVSATATEGLTFPQPSVVVALSNAGKRPITMVAVFIYDHGSQPDGVGPVYAEGPIRGGYEWEPILISPETQQKLRPGGKAMELDTIVSFTDSNGLRWLTPKDNVPRLRAKVSPWRWWNPRGHWNHFRGRAQS